jgi:RNA polymerase sigma-70 factor (ECF subfamily)
MDQEAFQAFYEQTAAGLLAYLWSLMQERAAAEDLMQECYMRMLSANLPETMDDMHRRSYMFRMAANLVKDRFRSRTREGEMPQKEPSVEDTSRHVELKHLVDSAFTFLRPEDRQLLWLAYAEEMSHKEIAGLTGYKVGSVRPLLSQARHRLANAVRSLMTGGKHAEQKV